MVSGATMGGSSKGFGGGSGGGIGSGQGIGVGNGKNMIGKFKPVMGAKVQATKIAVFMDGSSSMSEYLARVKKEICDQFVDADIFYGSGTWINVKEGVIIGGSKYKGAPGGKPRAPVVLTDPDKLSSAGKRIFRAHGEDFGYGSAGAWIDIMRNQREYDALIIFSDFQDGVKQYRNPSGDKSKELKWKTDPLVFFDYYQTFPAKKRMNSPSDDRTEQEKKWEEDLVKTFSEAKTGKGPRLYLFSIQFDPQPIYAKLVDVSGGQIKVLDWKTGGNSTNVTTDKSIEIKKSSVSTPASTTR